MKLIDVALYIIAFITLFAGAFLLAFFLIETRIAECTSDPLTYAEQKLKDHTDVDSATASLYGGGSYFYFKDGMIKNLPSSLNISDIKIEF